jgi:nucleotide-binding universal stress UspA family protein
VTILDSSQVRFEGIGLLKAPNLHAVRAERMQIAREHIQQTVGDFQTACQTASIRHRIVEESGDAFTRLLDLTRYHDLMVFGLRSIFEYDFLAGDPESLLIRLVGAGVRPLIAVTEQHRSISRVLIAYSGSIESATSMKRFVQMRLWPDAELRVVTFHSDTTIAFELLREAENYCRSHGFSVCHDSDQGAPEGQLLAAAKMWEADMIVMGNSGRNVLLRKLLGDTLRATLHSTDRPLFLAQ